MILRPNLHKNVPVQALLDVRNIQTHIPIGKNYYEKILKEEAAHADDPDICYKFPFPISFKYVDTDITV